MSCLRCGKETKDEQVFCSDCLVQMEQQPVKPGTPIYIPHRLHTQALKPVRKRRDATQEEKLALMTKLTRWLILAVAVLTILSCVLGVFLHDALTNREDPPVGRNYTYVGDNLNQ